MDTVNSGFDDEHPEVKALWLEIGAKHRYQPCFKPSTRFVHEFASDQPKLVEPLLRQLLKWDDDKKEQVKAMINTMDNALELHQLVE